MFLEIQGILGSRTFRRCNQIDAEEDIFSNVPGGPIQEMKMNCSTINPD